MTDPKVLEGTLEKTRLWLDELAGELGTDDRNYAYRVLRGYLHTLRDRISLEEAVQLGAQLPQLIRGMYYEGWVPARTPLGYHDVDEFLRRVAAEASLNGETEASIACEATTRVMHRHVSEGEIRDVLAVLPEELRTLLTV